MASVGFSVWNSQTFVAPVDLQPGERRTLATSGPISNNTAQKGCRLIGDYEALSPNIPGGTFELYLVIEGKDSLGRWYPVGYQFSPMRLLSIAPQRQLVIQPDISDFNTGIDDSVYVGTEIARISRQQGFLPPTEFRVCLCVIDSNPGPSGFQSVTLSVAGEKYDVG